MARIPPPYEEFKYPTLNIQLPYQPKPQSYDEIVNSIIQRERQQQALESSQLEQEIRQRGLERDKKKEDVLANVVIEGSQRPSYMNIAEAMETAGLYDDAMKYRDQYNQERRAGLQEAMQLAPYTNMDARGELFRGAGMADEMIGQMNLQLIGSSLDKGPGGQVDRILSDGTILPIRKGQTDPEVFKPRYVERVGPDGRSVLVKLGAEDVISPEEAAQGGFRDPGIDPFKQELANKIAGRVLSVNPRPDGQPTTQVPVKAKPLPPPMLLGESREQYKARLLGAR